MFTWRWWWSIFGGCKNGPYRTIEIVKDSSNVSTRQIEHGLLYRCRPSIVNIIYDGPSHTTSVVVPTQQYTYYINILLQSLSVSNIGIIRGGEGWLFI